MSWLPGQESSCVGAGLSLSNQVACNFGTLELVRFSMNLKEFSWTCLEVHNCGEETQKLLRKEAIICNIESIRSRYN